MRIEQATRYRCDGCGTEQINPVGWSSIVPHMAGGMTMTIGGGSAIASQDYCSECIKNMRAAAKLSAHR